MRSQPPLLSTPWLLRNSRAFSLFLALTFPLWAAVKIYSLSPRTFPLKTQIKLFSSFLLSPFLGYFISGNKNLNRKPTVILICFNRTGPRDRVAPKAIGQCRARHTSEVAVLCKRQRELRAGSSRVRFLSIRAIPFCSCVDFFLSVALDSASPLVGFKLPI